MKKLLVIVTCLTTAGCTKTEPVPQGQISPITVPSPTAPPRVDSRPVVAVLGDSLAEGLGVEAGKSFPDLLQRRLDQSGYKYRVVNLGISGDTTTGGLGRIGTVLELKPAIVVLELGGNDGLRGLPLAGTKANLESMIRSAQRAGAEVLLAGMTLPPNYGADYIGQFEAIYEELAAKHRLRLIPFLMEEIRTQMGSNPGLMQPDGIHPTAQGQSLIADTVFKYLQPMLKRAAEARATA